VFDIRIVFTGDVKLRIQNPGTRRRSKAKLPQGTQHGQLEAASQGKSVKMGRGAVPVNAI
jgi:hypothetical protein